MRSGVQDLGYKIWGIGSGVQDLGYRIWNGGKISAAGGPAEAAQGLPPSMHPHPPTLTHLQMSSRLTLIHPDYHLLGKNKKSVLLRVAAELSSIHLSGTYWAG